MFSGTFRLYCIRTDPDLEQRIEAVQDLVWA